MPAPTTVLPRAVPFVSGLARHGDRPALLGADGALSYAELAERFDAVVPTLGAGRRLVALTGGNRLDVVVHYLAALSAGHVVLLLPAGSPHRDALVRAYDVDVVVEEQDGRCAVRERHPGSTHELHPELALLLSTSGSTGSPKLVRLSHENLAANAEAIATALDVRPEDRAATTLPLHYCYGLSVLHSHLARGAAVVLTELSVVDRCFWELVRQERVSTFAGVPYTFELLDRVGLAGMDLPDLRYVTQAGGRLAPERVRHWSEVGRRRGWDLVVMYGQTEATARMAVLPPGLAQEHPSSIGHAVPGGSFRLDPVDDADDGVGELVFQGPNVMLGYATGPEDLTLGRTVEELRTGDLARTTPDGLVEIVGRRSRFLKLVGLRIDLAAVEETLAADGLVAACAGDDDRLLVAVERRRTGTVPAGRDRAAGADAAARSEAPGRPGRPSRPVRADDVRRRLVRSLGLPAAAVGVAVVERLPVLPSGKPDLIAVREVVGAGTRGAVPAVVGPQARPEAGAGPASETAPATADTADTVRRLYAELLERPDATVDSSFVELGGDSLSFVEVSVRLEALLGDLPTGWHTLPVRELTARTEAQAALPGDDVPTTTLGRLRSALRGRTLGGRTLGTRLDTAVVLRAVGILLVVLHHSDVLMVVGGAHLLMAVVGWNLARFQLSIADRRARLRAVLGSVARMAVPSAVWIAVVGAVTGMYGLANVVMLNGLLGPDRWGSAWHFWFLEAVVTLVPAVALLLGVPAVDRADRRHPLAVPLAVLGVGLVFRYGLVVLDTGPRIQVPQMLLWLLALGWAAARARTRPERVVVSALACVAVVGFFGDPVREALVAGAVVALVWVRSVRVPAAVARAAAVLAASSLAVYVTHWVVYPPFEARLPWVGALASFAVGILWWRLTAVATAAVVGRVRRSSRR